MTAGHFGLLSYSFVVQLVVDSILVPLTCFLIYSFNTDTIFEGMVFEDPKRRINAQDMKRPRQILTWMNSHCNRAEGSFGEPEVLTSR